MQDQRKNTAQVVRRPAKGGLRSYVIPKCQFFGLLRLGRAGTQHFSLILSTNDCGCDRHKSLISQ
jgi:hypothetical protein